MSITHIHPLPIGNALRLVITPPRGADWWRVLRRTADAFTGPDDPGAVRVADQCADNALLDDAGLVNGVPYVYRAYYRVGGGWTASGPAVGVAAATYRGEGPDAPSILRDRLAAGLAVEVGRGALTPASGAVPVIAAPLAAVPTIAFPCLSVRLDSDAPAERGLGDLPAADRRAPEDGWPDGGWPNDGWIESEGWLSRVQISVVGASRDADERSALRQAIRRVVVGNLPVFAAHGLSACDFTQLDGEDLTRADGPLFLTTGSFVCLAPTLVSDAVGAITDVDATLFTSGMEPT